MRYILSFDCSMPFVVDGVEFVRCTVVGQSFMLHQIRKLVGMMLGVVRGAWTEDDLVFALKTKESCTAPMAPELGLFLCECIYHAYNVRYGETHEPLRLDAHADKVEAFKTKHIYPHMAATEKEEETMETWIRMLPVRQIRNALESARRKDGGRAYEAKTGKNKKRKGAPGTAAEGGAVPRDESRKKTNAATDANVADARAVPTPGSSAPPSVVVPAVDASGDAAERKPPRATSSGRGGGRGKVPDYGGAGGGGGGGGGGRGRGPKNQVRNASMKSNDDFDPAELSD